ncbi:MAG: hypothetical protein KIT80_04435 [Chitinophagaceae bacterium]|nr:hypothetical protein [Chitinophagaceae bacterium]MCW5926138.1 hypothetical protein [Chitinophagaceae bacterium]
MTSYLKLIFLLWLSFACFSCSKEISEEKPVNPDVKDNCMLTQVIPFDGAPGKALGSYNVTINDQLPSRVTWVDSISGNTVFSIGFTHKNDTIRISGSEYFIVDAKGRISEMVVHQVPGNSSTEKYKYRYQYDGQGYLKSKTWYLVSDAGANPVFEYSYTWQEGNLVKTEVRETSGEKRLALVSELTYDLSLQAKNFLYCFPESIELAPFSLMLNLGNKPKNLVSKITVRVYNANGTVEDSYTTVYRQYQFTEGGYVSQVFAEGDAVDGLLIVNGLTKFHYTCK